MNCILFDEDYKFGEEKEKGIEYVCDVWCNDLCCEDLCDFSLFLVDFGYVD